jgi:hypothetical protein
MCFSVFAAIGLAQDLTPRAYIITPVGSNAVTLTYNFSAGNVLTDPSVPVEGARGKINLPVANYYRSFDFFGRSSNLVVGLPYAVAFLSGTVAGEQQSIYRSGLAQMFTRFSVNLYGGPAKKLHEFAKYREKTLLGASVTVMIPTGQYDPARLVNPGLNRWAVKPELGFAKTWNHWSLDVYGGVWFYGANDRYFPGHNRFTETPIGAVETHLTYNWKPRLWTSLDANFWAGGDTAINAIHKNDKQTNSRVGATAAIPITKHQSLKFAYSGGAYITIGGDFHTVSAAWQYSWFGKPF